MKHLLPMVDETTESLETKSAGTLTAAMDG